MKKFTKIWLLSLALAACLTVLKANATTMDTKTVSLSLTAWSNSCTIQNYNFGSFNVSVNDQSLEPQAQDVECTFLENAQGYVNIQLANLTATEWTITADNFEFSVDAANAVWLISNLSATATGAFPRQIYVKEANKLWSWSTKMAIKGTIPGWTPAGTYQGNLDLVIQATQG